MQLKRYNTRKHSSGGKLKSVFAKLIFSSRHFHAACRLS
ncbi:hypothetical protein AND4_03174 [Vibrio sp. AND4]|nr:hypothetical protein AND4_03174 [Vibrio sp. AND4]